MKRRQKAVEEVFEEYRRYLATMSLDLLPKVTPSYSIIPPCVTNEFNSSTENIAIERIEYERTREKFMRWIHRAVNRLPNTERKIVIMFYMNEEMGYDPDIREEIGIGKQSIIS